ncbi:MAG: hypothetical protein DRP54_02770 [Spirochaetes bacterium]|nr:MAG: hypothetical protein DRP54_02770 [Spirochaetota bacterium]
MYLMIIQLYKHEYKEDLFLAFTSCGIKRASFTEGFNLDKILQEEFSLFKGIIKPKEERERYSLIIFSTVESKETVKELIQILKDSGMDVDNEDIMRIALIPTVLVKDIEINWEKEE